VKMTRLSCHRFRSNEVRLWLSVIACNLGNLWRRLVLPQRVDKWSLTGLQQRLVKTGGRLIKHARYYWLLLRAETERCLSNGRERRDSAVLGPSGRARTPPSEGESGAREEELHPEGSKGGHWVYSGLESGAENGNPGQKHAHLACQFG